MRESFGPDGALDLGGLALVTCAAFGVVWGLVRGNAAGWGSVEVVGSLVARACCWPRRSCAWELRVARPDAADALLPLARLHGGQRRRSSSRSPSLFGAVFFLAQFLQTGLGYGPLGAGLRLLPWTVTLFFVAPVAGALVDRFGERPFMVGGLALQGIGMGWIALIADPAMAYASMIAPLIIAGCGVSMSSRPAQNSVIGAVPPEAVGQGRGDEHHDARARRRVRDRGARRGVRGRGRLRVAAGVRRRLRARARRDRGPVASPVRWWGSGCPGAPPTEASLRRSRGRGWRRPRDRSRAMSTCSASHNRARNHERDVRTRVRPAGGRAPARSGRNAGRAAALRHGIPRRESGARGRLRGGRPDGDAGGAEPRRAIHVDRRLRGRRSPRPGARPRSRAHQRRVPPGRPLRSAVRPPSPSITSSSASSWSTSRGRSRRWRCSTGCSGRAAPSR